jgi:hypothetical protein
MADKTLYQLYAELFADIYKELGELSVVTTAQNEALRDLVPDYESRFEQHLQGERCQRAKREYEQKIRVFLEAAQKLSKN